MLKFLQERVPAPGRSLGHFDGAPVLLSANRHCMHSPSPVHRSLYFILTPTHTFAPPTYIPAAHVQLLIYRLIPPNPYPPLRRGIVIVSDCMASVRANSMYFHRPGHSSCMCTSVRATEAYAYDTPTVALHDQVRHSGKDRPCLCPMHTACVM